MIIVAIAGFLTVCWLLLKLTTLALPVYAGIAAGLFALHTGAGSFGSILVGFTAGALTLATGQALFAARRSPVLRLLAGFAFAVPAAIAGYSAIAGLAHLAGSSETWQSIAGVVGAALIGGISWTRLHALRPDERITPPQ